MRHYRAPIIPQLTASTPGVPSEWNHCCTRNEFACSPPASYLIPQAILSAWNTLPDLKPFLFVLQVVSALRRQSQVMALKISCVSNRLWSSQGLDYTQSHPRWLLVNEEEGSIPQTGGLLTPGWKVPFYKWSKNSNTLLAKVRRGLSQRHLCVALQMTVSEGAVWLKPEKTQRGKVRSKPLYF